MKFILGTKLGMTQVFREDGTVVPVTRVSAGPCVVTQVKTTEKNRTNAVQIGYKAQKPFRLTKSLQGHLKDLPAVQYMRDIRTDDEDHGLKRGDEFTVSIFENGDKVQVMGRAKGRGFQGVVKRHNFKGASASHGTKDQVRMPGSIGATGPARVFKGTRMGGHMGDNRVTVKNLEIVEVHPETNELFIKGAIPGARGGLLVISTQDGKIEISEPAEEAPAVEETKEEAASTSAEAPADKPATEATEPATEEAPVEEKAEEPAKEEAPATEEKEEDTAPEDAPAEAEKKEEESSEENA